MNTLLMTFITFAPCMTAPFSLLGSSLTLTSLIRTKMTTARNELATYHRLLAGISVFDIVFSFGIALGPLPIPPGQGAIPGLQMGRSRGSTAFCTFQGFLIYLGYASFAYNSMLMLFYVLVIRYNTSERVLVRYVEPFMHFVPVGYYVTTAVLGLVWKMYNPGATYCFIQTSPAYCQDQPDVECLRGGEHISVFGNYVFLLVYVIWVALIVIWSVTVAVTVFQKHLQSRRFVFRGTMDGQQQQQHQQEQQQRPRSSRRRRSSPGEKKTRQVIIQCFLYAVTFLNSMVWTIIPDAASKLGNPLDLNSVLAIWAVTMVFLPLQGLFNFLIYIRTRYLSIREKFRGRGRYFALREAVWHPVASPEERASRALNVGGNRGGGNNNNNNNNSLASLLASALWSPPPASPAGRRSLTFRFSARMTNLLGSFSGAFSNGSRSRLGEGDDAERRDIGGSGDTERQSYCGGTGTDDASAELARPISGSTTSVPGKGEEGGGGCAAAAPPPACDEESADKDAEQPAGTGGEVEFDFTDEDIERRGG